MPATYYTGASLHHGESHRSELLLPPQVQQMSNARLAQLLSPTYYAQNPEFFGSLSAATVAWNENIDPDSMPITQNYIGEALYPGITGVNIVLGIANDNPGCTTLEALLTFPPGA